MTPELLAGMERYSQIKAWLQTTVDQMHYNLAAGCDLAGLEQLAKALDRVALHGDRIAVSTARRVAHEERLRAQAEREAAARL
jgi:hypothetical protein